MGAFKNELEERALTKVEEISQKHYLLPWEKLPPHLKFVVYEVAEEIARFEMSGN